MGRGKRQSSKWIMAVFAAYVLVLQGLFGALASGRHVGVMIVDQAIHLTTCDPDSWAAVPADGDHQSKLPPCCAQGCTIGVATGDVPPVIATVVAYETFALVDREPHASQADASPVDESSGRPRAPPHHLRTT